MPSAKFYDLKSKCVLITGGGSGIGAALTKGFLEQGAKVAFLEINDASEFYLELKKLYNDNIVYYRCDVTNSKSVKAAIAKIKEQHGPVEVLINNAADDIRHNLYDVSENFWDQLVNINLKSYYFIIQMVASDMELIGSGVIINFTSISYMMGNTGYPVYTTCNSGINGMTRSLARELGPSGIRINTIAPGWVMTQKQLKKWVTAEAIEQHLKRQCLKQAIQPEDLVGAALFLASDSSAMITGQSIIVDAGVVTSG